MLFFRRDPIRNIKDWNPDTDFSDFDQSFHCDDQRCIQGIWRFSTFRNGDVFIKEPERFVVSIQEVNYDRKG